MSVAWLGEVLVCWCCLERGNEMCIMYIVYQKMMRWLDVKNEIPKISDFQSLGLCDGFAKVIRYLISML